MFNKRACAKPVLISKTKGFWDFENIKDKKHLVFIQSNSLLEWVTIKELKEDTIYRKKVGQNACSLVKNKFNLYNFTKSMVSIIS